VPDEPLHTPTGKYREAEATCTRPRRIQKKGCSGGLDNETDRVPRSLLDRGRALVPIGFVASSKMRSETLAFPQHLIGGRAICAREALVAEPGLMAGEHPRPKLGHLADNTCHEWITRRWKTHLAQESSYLQGQRMASRAFTSVPTGEEPSSSGSQITDEVQCPR
jgi:hypothetical protein